MFSFSRSFINSGKQGGSVALREGHDILIGETCISASLNINNLGEALFCSSLFTARAVPISAYR
jgi:hypothetical protein